MGFDKLFRSPHSSIACAREMRMAYYLSKERNQDVVEAYRQYQQYLREHEREFPPGAFALGTAEWYQNPNDHRCPHDGWLENFIVSENVASEKRRATSIQTRLLAAYHDGYIEFFYPQVFSYTLENPTCARGLGDWLYDEFRLSSNGRVIHEIEWAGFPHEEGSRWIIEASDVQFRWIPQSICTTH
jgi:hypothetical protein